MHVLEHNLWGEVAVKKLLLAGFAFGALAAPAFAADMPVPVAPVATWSGMYVGVNGGYFQGANNNINVVGLPNPCNAPVSGCQINPNGTTGPGFATGGSSNPYQGPTYSNTSGLAATFDTPAKQKGVIYGGQIGLNSQIVPKIVVGLEADLQGVSNNNDTVTVGSVTPNANFPGFPVIQTATLSSKLDYLGTIRARAGYLITPSFLVYVTGGLAFGKTDFSTSITQNVNTGVTGPYSAAANESLLRFGGTIGGGVEWLLTQNWSVKAEYLYVGLDVIGTSTLNLTLVNPLAGLNFSSATVLSSAHFDENLVRAGLNYHF
jgi:outer membrane immunogenic protein